MARNRKKKFNETQIYLDGIALNDELNRICLNMQRDYRNVYFPILSNNCYAFLRAFLKVYDENNNDLKYKLCCQLFSRIREIELSMTFILSIPIKKGYTSKADILHYRCRLNSYLGFMRHRSSYNIRKKLFSSEYYKSIKNYLIPCDHYSMVVIKSD